MKAETIEDDNPIVKSPEAPGGKVFDPKSIRRPDQALLTYFLVISGLTFVAFPIVFLPLYFKYRTLQYEFDDDGIMMRWGILFRQEINLTYRRIQDIHVTRGLIQRWLGLASLSVQTASGTAGAEMTIIGIRNPEALRDFLYRKMRGATDDEHDGRETPEAGTADAIPHTTNGSEHSDEALTLLRSIRDELRGLRKALSSDRAVDSGQNHRAHSDEETSS